MGKEESCPNADPDDENSGFSLPLGDRKASSVFLEAVGWVDRRGDWPAANPERKGANSPLYSGKQTLR